MTNVKKIGDKFEQEFCEILANAGYWCHLIVPNRAGAQPFDVIAARNGIAYAFDCKTCVSNRFSVGRIEENQKCAFELWQTYRNPEPFFAVKHNDVVYMIPWSDLCDGQSVRIDTYPTFDRYDKWRRRSCEKM